MAEENATVFQAWCQRCGWSGELVPLVQALEEAAAHLLDVHDTILDWRVKEQGKDDATC